MIATAPSSKSNRICEINNKVTSNNESEGPVLPSNVNNKCPAIIFAANRTARVPGRITFLIVSIKTINGIKGPGVPCGTKWANICWVWLIQPYSMKATHKGRERDKVIAKWLVLVKIYGRRPKLLLNTISEKRVTKIIVLPAGELANKTLNSLCKVVITLDHSKDQRDGIIQKSAGINIIPRNVDNQFKDKFIIEDTGSKTENKFVIIFKLC